MSLISVNGTIFFLESCKRKYVSCIKNVFICKRESFDSVSEILQDTKPNPHTMVSIENINSNFFTREKIINFQFTIHGSVGSRANVTAFSLFVTLLTHVNGRAPLEKSQTFSTSGQNWLHTSIEFDFVGPFTAEVIKLTRYFLRVISSGEVAKKIVCILGH